MSLQTITQENHINFRFDNPIAANAGLYISGSSNLLNKYSEVPLTLSISGGSLVPMALSAVFIQMGDIITVNFVYTAGAGNGGTADWLYTAASTIPAQFLPTRQNIICSLGVLSGGNAAIGAVQFATDGSIKFYSSTAMGKFATTGLCGVLSGSCSYSVSNL